MKVLIVSDTHGRDENLEIAINREAPFDMLVHCGDVEGREFYIEALAECPCSIVSGNNDFFSDLPREDVIEVEGKNDSVIMETVKGLFSDKNKDFVTEVDEQNIILVKDATELGSEEEAENIARMIVDTLHAEAMVRVRVGYGTAVDKLQDIPKSYQEAKMALEVGNIFYVESETISYARLGIGRLIYQLPMSLCEMFIAEIFGERKLDLDDETLVTIQKFFENNLNISETARQLYVHRNTLVYRLERLQKMIGLDIRKFEDAMTFKIAMMVIAHMTYQTGGLEE